MFKVIVVVFVIDCNIVDLSFTLGEKHVKDFGIYCPPQPRSVVTDQNVASFQLNRSKVSFNLLSCQRLDTDFTNPVFYALIALPGLPLSIFL